MVQKAINETMFVISFCDFGDVDVVKGTSLKPLPNAFRVLPELAINVRLAGTKSGGKYDRCKLIQNNLPQGVDPLREDWKSDECILFRRLVEDRSFVSHVTGITSKGPFGDDAQIELRLIDISSGEDIDVGNVLLEKNIAIKSKA